MVENADIDATYIGEGCLNCSFNCSRCHRCCCFLLRRLLVVLLLLLLLLLLMMKL